MTSEQTFKLKREEDYLERMIETRNKISPLHSDSFRIEIRFNDYESVNIDYLLPQSKKDSITDGIKILVLHRLDYKIAEQKGYINQLKQEYGNSN